MSLHYYGESIRIYQPNHMKFNLSPNLSVAIAVPTLTLCILIAGCVEEQASVTGISEPPASVDQLTDAPVPPESESATVIQVLPDEPPVELTEPEPEPTAWELIIQAGDSDEIRNANLIRATDILLNNNRVSQAMTIADLIAVDELSETERLDYDILRARIHQLHTRHKSAYRLLGKTLKSPLLSPEQMIRITRLRAHSASYLDDPLPLISELVRFYAMLPPGSERMAVGHQLWDILGTLSSEDLAAALVNSDAADARPWIILTLNINRVRHNPQQMNKAVNNWTENYPDHPAAQIARTGIAFENLTYAKIAVLLPLSSQSSRAARAFMDGMTTQYHADTAENKPILEFVDIGNDPTQVTQFYYQALLNGAEFVIGPLGIGYVQEMARFGDFVVPTLLLGAADDIPLTDQVYQFALLPEHTGIVAARRARQDGHATALILESPSGWSKRAASAFRNEWERLGGAVILSRTFELDRGDYSDTIKEVFNIDQSVARYRTLRDLLGQSLKFIPRRRHDVDCIFLSADYLHGRLIKPHIDFLKAHDVPVYSTHHIFSGKVDKIADQDLDGVRFADMNWLIDQSDTMNDLRQKLSAGRSIPAGLSRIYAMGIDTYNLISRLDTLRGDPNMRYHGVTATIQVDETGRVLTNPRWAQFIDGTPELNFQLPDPERIDLPVNRQPSSEMTELRR